MLCLPDGQDIAHSLWKGVDGFFALAEGLVVLSTLLFASQVVFGWWRRCSSNVFMKHWLWVAYTFTPSVVTYTLGFMGTFYYMEDFTSDIKGDAFILLVWSVSLVTALGSTYSMTAYDVDDNKQSTRHLAQHALYVVNLAYVLRFNMGLNGRMSTLGWATFSILFLFWPPILARYFASRRISSCSNRVFLYLQEHMEQHELSSTNNYNPVTLEGYNYFIYSLPSPDPQSNRSRTPVTVSKVWLCNEGILRGNGGQRLKEICLSYSFIHLLKRRFFGAPCPEAEFAFEKTRDLVLKGLLPDVAAAYRVIETELAFAHDHFFTSSPYLGRIILIFGVLKVVVYLTISSYLALIFCIPSEYGQSADRKLRARASTTVLIMMVLVALELLQLYIYLSSDFVRVLAACWATVYPGEGIWSPFYRACNKLPQLFGYWQNKIGQHSLIKDLHGRSYFADLMGSLSWLIFHKLLNYPSAFPRGIFKPGVKDADRIPLTNEVKVAIARTLESSNGKLSNGALSLVRNNQPGLSNEFLLKCHRCDMLIWHIATEYCDIEQSLRVVEQQAFKVNHHVARSLSSYCCYLMAFVPELLPDHHIETTKMFHRARGEALKHLHGKRLLQSIYETMRDESAGDGTVFMKGIQLGKKLKMSDDETRWKILADFWTEMILYIAPSNNAREHVQHLANGGEFLTHLWALLTHAGILDRSQRNNGDIESAGAARTYHVCPGSYPSNQ